MKSLNKTQNDIPSEQLPVTKEEMVELASKYRNIEVFKNCDDETTFWYIVLFILSKYIEYDTEKLWDSFADEIKTKNRFFPESELLKKLSVIAEKATCTFPKGKILYRARDYSQRDFLKNDLVVSLSEIMKEEFSDFGFDDTDIFSESAVNIASITLCGDEEKRKRIADRIDSLMKKEDEFYGYDKSNSDAPPNACAKEGRANPQGISYLYTALDIETAILEMRPQMQKVYNVATIEITKNAKLFDFTYSPNEIKGDEYSVVADLHRISEEFSNPNFGDTLEYAPTQFLCEFIKKLGFDGIKYKSAVSKTGTTVLLFDVDEKSRVYDVTGSKVYVVKSLDIDVDPIMPIENP